MRTVLLMTVLDEWQLCSENVYGKGPSALLSPPSAMTKFKLDFYVYKLR